MADVNWDDRARSALQRAREERASLLQASRAGHTRSKLISQGQKVAEYSLRAILYARSIRVPKTHELHTTAQKWRGVLGDIWAELEPLLQHYGWLYSQRQVADYQHADAPSSQGYVGVDSPPIPEESAARALEAANRFCELAECVVEG